MERTQRIIELRLMFLQLADILIKESREDKSRDELEEIRSNLERIHTELAQLEREREEQNPILGKG